MLKSWHRTIGLIASVFLLALTVTGLALMQTDAFDLDSRYVDNEHVLDWYGVRPAPPPLGFRAGDRWLTQLGDRLYFDQRYVSNMASQLIGVVPADGELLVASAHGMLLLTGDGEIAERVDAIEGGALRRIGIDAGGAIVLDTGEFTRRYDPVLGAVVEHKAVPPVRWSLEASVPADLETTLTRNYRGSGLSLERVLLDLHTGRLFGSLGVLLVNTASVMLLVLVISGFVMWVGRARA